MLASNLFSLWELVQLVNSWNLLWAAHTFGITAAPPDRNMIAPESVKKQLRLLAVAIKAECSVLSLKNSWVSATRIIALCDKDGATSGEFADLCGDQFFGRLADEMSATTIYAVDFPSAYMLTNPALFGDSVADAFPSATFDIAEAGKCLAFGRGTACVFHCMRALEIGLRVLADAMGIPYAPSWESYLRQISAQVARDWKEKDPKWKAKEPFYTSVAADLATVKNAWRNPTMHVRGVYTEERASEIFNATKSFMRHLSTELREKPEAITSP